MNAVTINQRWVCDATDSRTVDDLPEMYSTVLISASSSAIAQTALQGALGLAKSERLELGDNIFRTL